MQRVPIITSYDIKRIIDRDFPHINHHELETLLNDYKSENEKGRYRVQASILKLSNGDIGLVKVYVEKANLDYRDIIALSEYPNYTKHFFHYDLSDEKKQQLIDNDWKQFEAWLNK